MLRLVITFTFYLCFTLNGQASSYQILQEKRLASLSFTQGFAKTGSRFYLSSGGYGKSFIAVFDEDSRILNKVFLDKTIFAEGLTVFDEQLYLLSWKSGKLFRFQTADLSWLDSIPFDGEGWGLTHTTTHFLLSNGSPIIQFKRFDNFETVKELEIRFRGAPLSDINELEFAEGYLWANVWHDDHIYQIDIDSGDVLNRWNLARIRLAQGLKHPEAVLNGIAYDQQTRAFWITGKLWSKRYLVRFYGDNKLHTLKHVGRNSEHITP